MALQATTVFHLGSSFIALNNYRSTQSHESFSYEQVLPSLDALVDRVERKILCSFGAALPYIHPISYVHHGLWQEGWIVHSNPTNISRHKSIFLSFFSSAERSRPGTAGRIMLEFRVDPHRLRSISERGHHRFIVNTMAL